jgi:hypothetical protein
MGILGKIGYQLNVRRANRRVDSIFAVELARCPLGDCNHSAALHDVTPDGGDIAYCTVEGCGCTTG